MKVIFTCGGTAGHVNPALALAGYMREKDAGTQILFVGAERGLERDLIAHTDYPFRTVNISSFHRSFRPAEIKHNLVSLKNLAHAEREANAILNDFHPDLIVGTGGYASYPLVRYGAKAGIPTAVHESNIVPGLTTRQLEPHCDRIMVGFEDCRAHYKHPEKVVVTGTPVRGDFFTISKQQAKEKLGMNDGRKLIVSFWGSLGSNAMNRAMAEFLALESAKEPFYYIHGFGEICWKPMQQWMHDDGLEITEHPALDVREYIYDMPLVMAAADLVMCRAGASTLAELTAALKAMGQPGFRAKQIFHWVHQKLVTEFSAMTDQPKTLLAKLEEQFYIAAPKIERRQEAKDGTVKYLLRMADGNCIETVVMRYHYGNTVCVSTQVGCRMGCRFCASTQAGRVRNLEAGEICSEIYTAQKDIGERISHIVLMGIGEPLDNFDEVMRFLENISSPEGVNIGMRNISLSTCGLVPKIDQLAEKKLQLTLSVSLHAPDSETRSRIMPVNRAWDVEELFAACHRYFRRTGRRISFEYAMIDGVNDHDWQADLIARRIAGMPGHVNLIPLNDVVESPFKPSRRIAAFQKRLESHGITATVRRSLGGDIDASCGQLRRRAMEERKGEDPE